MPPRQAFRHSRLLRSRTRNSDSRKAERFRVRDDAPSASLPRWQPSAGPATCAGARLARSAEPSLSPPGVWSRLFVHFGQAPAPQSWPLLLVYFITAAQRATLACPIISEKPLVPVAKQSPATCIIAARPDVRPNGQALPRAQLGQGGLTRNRSTKGRAGRTTKPCCGGRGRGRGWRPTLQWSSSSALKGPHRFWEVGPTMLRDGRHGPGWAVRQARLQRAEDLRARALSGLCGVRRRGAGPFGRGRSRMHGVNAQLLAGGTSRDRRR